MLIKNGKFWLGDCLELMKDIPDGSVDMILCDLPYGTTACKWDTVIPFEPLWKQYWRIAKPNAAVVLTASQPFTTALISSQIECFKYEWIWEKSKASNFMHSKRQPLKAHENICIFSKRGCSATSKNPMNYNPVETEGSAFNKGVAKKEMVGVFGNTKRLNNDNSTGLRKPRTVQYFRTAESEGKHPTQKPVALFEYLIKTYTNEGETVLDNCAGSGTTAVAAENTNRKWICIEQLPEYYYPAVMRVAAL